jgi:hypothetical protein
VTMLFVDARGGVVRSFSSVTATPRSDSAAAASGRRKPPADSLAYFASDSIVTTRPGSNRFFWNLQVGRAKEIKTVVNDMGTLAGPSVVPGDYRVRMIVGADTATRAFAVKLDPRLEATTADLQQAFDLGMKVQGKINDIVDAFARIEDLQKQIDVRVAQSSEHEHAKRVKDAAAPVREQLEVVRTELVDWYNHDDQSTLHFPIKLYNMMLSLNSQVIGQEAAPTKQHGEILADLGGKVDVQLQRLQQMEANELLALNKLLQGLGLPPIYISPSKAKTVS